MRFNRVIKSAILLSIIAVLPAHAIQLSQQKIELKVNKTSSIELTNDAESRVAVRVRVVPETLPGALAKLPAEFKSCDKHLKAFPVMFELEPGKYQVVKFMSRGEGHCRVYFETDKLDANGAETFEKTEQGISIHTKIATGLPVVVK